MISVKRLEVIAYLVYLFDFWFRFVLGLFGEVFVQSKCLQDTIVPLEGWSKSVCSTLHERPWRILYSHGLGYLSGS